jgi:hypothetical protein
VAADTRTQRAGGPLHRVLRFELVVEWFDRYLKG